MSKTHTKLVINTLANNAFIIFYNASVSKIKDLLNILDQNYHNDQFNCYQCYLEYNEKCLPEFSDLTLISDLVMDQAVLTIRRKPWFMKTSSPIMYNETSGINGEFKPLPKISTFYLDVVPHE